jgi:hypothetical protein
MNTGELLGARGARADPLGVQVALDRLEHQQRRTLERGSFGACAHDFRGAARVHSRHDL